MPAGILRSVVIWEQPVVKEAFLLTFRIIFLNRYDVYMPRGYAFSRRANS
jgi:hypothetical protein